MKALYTAEVTVQGGREGHFRSADGTLEMDLKMPVELGGPGGKGTNPEQLFAAAYAACFESALRMVAAKLKKPVRNAAITARVTINAADGGGFAISAELKGKIEGLPKEEVLTLMHTAHQVCPYSLAIRGNVDVKLSAD